MENSKSLMKYFTAAVCSGLLLLGSQAWAMTLQEAKAAGYLGEQTNGYVGVVSANTEASQIADSINAQRKAEYESIASKNGTTLDAVEALAGQTAINKTPGGQYVNTGSGWQKK